MMRETENEMKMIGSGTFDKGFFLETGLFLID